MDEYNSVFDEKSLYKSFYNIEVSSRPKHNTQSKLLETKIPRAIYRENEPSLELREIWTILTTVALRVQSLSVLSDSDCFDFSNVIHKMTLSSNQLIFPQDHVIKTVDIGDFKPFHIVFSDPTNSFKYDNIRNILIHNANNKFSQDEFSVITKIFGCGIFINVLSRDDATDGALNLRISKFELSHINTRRASSNLRSGRKTMHSIQPNQWVTSTPLNYDNQPDQFHSGTSESVPTMRSNTLTGNFARSQSRSRAYQPK